MPHKQHHITFDDVADRAVEYVSILLGNTWGALAYMALVLLGPIVPAYILGAPYLVVGLVILFVPVALCWFVAYLTLRRTLK